MEGKTDKKEQGFSLIELIIAIAILVILTGFLAPQFMRYIEKSRESVCRKNMDEMLNVYRAEHVGDTAYRVANVIEDYEDKEPCPSGGEYADYTNVVNMPWIMCSVHDVEDWGKDGNTIISNKVYNAMREFAAESAKEVAEATGLPEKALTNDNLRKYLFDKFGGWPQFDEAILEKNGISGGPFYIQPYLNRSETDENGHLSPNGRPIHKTDKDKDVFLYANNGKSGGQWNANLIYNAKEGVWYTGKEFQIMDQNWEEIQKRMTENGWKPLK